MSERVLLSKTESAEALGISGRTLTELIRGREVNPRRVGRRVLITPDELRRFASGTPAAAPFLATLGIGSARTPARLT